MGFSGPTRLVDKREKSAAADEKPASIVGSRKRAVLIAIIVGDSLVR
jgi:hypothetical protein